MNINAIIENSSDPTVGLDIERLYSDVMPDFEFSFFRPFYHAYCNLENEVDASAKRRCIVTRLEDELQVVELWWDGQPLREGTIGILNERYSSGANYDSIPRRHGSLIAGYFIGRYDSGSITIENHAEGIYVARNIIKIPRKIETIKEIIGIGF